MYINQPPKLSNSTPHHIPQISLLPSNNSTNATLPIVMIHHPSPGPKSTTTYFNGTSTVKFANGTKVTYTPVPAMTIDGIDTNYRYTWGGNVVIFSPFIFLGIVLGVIICGTSFRRVNPGVRGWRQRLGRRSGRR